MRTKTFFKVILLLVLGIFYINLDTYVTAIYPAIANMLAMAQMNNSADSSMWILLYSKINNYAWEIWIFLTLVLFHKELINAFKKLKEIIENEEEY